MPGIIAMVDALELPVIEHDAIKDDPDSWYVISPGGHDWPDIADILKRRVLAGPYPSKEAAIHHRDTFLKYLNASTWVESGQQFWRNRRYTIARQDGQIVTRPRPGIGDEIVTPRRSAPTEEIVTPARPCPPDGIVTRLCLCGCGREVIGNAKRRFASDACKMRFHRATIR